MAVTAFWYGVPLKEQWGTTAASRIDFATDTIKVALTTSSYTPAQDTHQFFSNVTNEITGTGYSAGGYTLAGKSLTYDTGTNEVRFDANDPSWTGATITARFAVYYKDTTVAGTSPLMGYVNMDGDQSVTSGTFTIVHPTNGFAKVTAA